MERLREEIPGTVVPGWRCNDERGPCWKTPQVTGCTEVLGLACLASRASNRGNSTANVGECPAGRSETQGLC